MAYVFDPTNNTLIDDEDKSLGNKLALNDEEFQKLLDIPGVFRASEASQPPVRPDVQEIEAINRFMRDNPVEKAKGGRLKAALPLLAPALLPYAAAFLGTAATGLGLQRQVQNYFENNPDAIDKFKDYVSRSIGYTGEGQVFGPDDKDKKEAEPIILSTPIETKGITDYRESFGDDELAKSLLKTKPETFPAGENIKPVVEGFPADTEQLPIIFENKKAQLKEFKDTFDKSKKLYDEKKMSEVVKVTDKNFAQKLANFVDTNYDGRLEPAVKDILGVKEKTKDVENLRIRINSLFKNRGIERGKRTGNIAPSTLSFETDTSKTSWSDFTTKVSQDSSYIKNLTKPLIKEGLIDKSQYLPQNDLEKIFSIDHGNNKSAKNNMGYIIKNLSKEGGIRNIEGKFPKYHLGDVMKAFQLKYGEGGKKIYGINKKGTAKKYKELTSFDKSLASVIDGFQNSFESAAKIEGLTEKKPTGKQGIINKATPDHSHAEPRSTMLKFPNVFKNSNLKTFQTITLTDPIFNQEILSKGGFEAKKIKIYRTLNNYIGKKVTPEIQNILTEQKTKLNNINSEILLKANEAGLQGVEKTFVPIDINIPNVGEKFRSENIFGDTTGKNIMGNVDEINPNAKVYDDLSKEEKLIYRDNLINEYIDYYKDFYERAEFDEDDIASFIDRALEGDPTAQRLPISEKINKASGGGVKITPLPRANFGNGGAAGADENFAAELEYFLTNPDAELPKMQTYKETMNPIEVLNDIIDPRNYPYYADVLARSGIRIGEFGMKILPATGKLINDLITRPAFKITATGNNYVQDYTDVLPSNIKGTGIFSEFLENITPTTLEKKIGLDKLIKAEEQKQIDRGSTSGPKVLADTIGLGAEVTAPIFPGLKLLNAYAKSKNLPVNDVTKKLLVKEVDEVLGKQGMDRRTFLQTTGAGATVILAKMLGFGDEVTKTAKVAEKATEVAAGGAPPYFFDLVEIIKKKGLDVTKNNATKNLENVHRYKGYEVYEDLATGEIRIEKIYPESDMITERQILEYAPGKADETTKGKPADSYEEVTETNSRIYKDEFNEPDYEEGVNIEEILEFIKNEKIN